MVQRTSGRGRSSRIKPDHTRMYIIIGIIAVAVVITTLVLLLYAPKAEAAEGMMSFAYEGKGLVIRKEKLYKSETYGKTTFLAQEGEVVTTGTAIADVYTWDYNANDVAQLNVIEDTIMDYQEKYILDESLKKELENMNTGVNQKAKEISDVVSGAATGNLIKLEQELKQLMQERQKFLNEAVAEDEQLKAFYEQRNDLETRIADWKQTILAESDGVVSFYFDGLETVLTPDNMTKLTPANIADVFAGKSIVPTSGNEPSQTSARSLYRLVEQNEWYVVFVADSRIAEFENPSNVFNVEFSAGENLTFSGSVSESQESGGKYLYYLKFTEPISDMVMARKVNMSITATFSGVQVPAGAVRVADNQLGVYVDNGGNKEFVAVKVKTLDDQMAIVEPENMSSPLISGCTVYA